MNALYTRIHVIPTTCCKCSMSAMQRRCYSAPYQRRKEEEKRRADDERPVQRVVPATLAQQGADGVDEQNNRHACDQAPVSI